MQFSSASIQWPLETETCSSTLVGVHARCNELHPRRIDKNEFADFEGRLEHSGQPPFDDDVVADDN